MKTDEDNMGYSKCYKDGEGPNEEDDIIKRLSNVDRWRGHSNVGSGDTVAASYVCVWHSTRP